MGRGRADAGPPGGRPHHMASQRTEFPKDKGGLALAGSPVEAGAIELRLFFGELGKAFGSGFFHEYRPHMVPL